MTSPARETPVPDMAIGSDVWPGLAKLAEECGELLQVIGKLMAFPLDPHPQEGSELPFQLQEELADVLAASEYVAMSNDALDDDALYERKREKLARFLRWDVLERSGIKP